MSDEILIRAVALHQAGRLEEARLLYRRVLAETPDQVDALHLLGLIAWRQGQARAGETLIIRALRGNPLLVAGYINIANLRHEQDDIAGAVAWLERGIADNPGHIGLREQHVRLCHDQAVLAVLGGETAAGVDWCRRTLGTLETLPALTAPVYELFERLIQIVLVAEASCLALRLLRIKNRYDFRGLAEAEIDLFTLKLYGFSEWCAASGLPVEMWDAPALPVPPALAQRHPDYLRRYIEALPALGATPVGVMTGAELEVVQGFYVKDNYETFILSGRRTMLCEVKETTVRSALVPLVGVTPGATAAAFRLPRAQYHVLEIGEPCLFLPSTPNYWHFMLEILPMVMACERVPALRALPIHLFDLRGYHYEMLELAGIARDRVVDMRTLVPPGVRQILYRFRQAATVSQIPYPVACRWLRETMLPQLRPGRKPTPRRVFLSRRGSYPKHRIVNDAEVGAFLAGYGFEVVQPETLSVLETVELVAGAEIVVAPIGAGTVNHVFLPPHGTWIHLNNPDFFHPDSPWNPQMGTQVSLVGHSCHLTGGFVGDPAGFPQRLVDRLEIPVEIDLLALGRLVEAAAARSRDGA